LHNQNANPTTDGWAILDAAITWATPNNGGGGGGTTTTTQPTTTTTQPTTTTTSGSTTTTTGGGGGSLDVLLLVNNPASLDQTEDRIRLHLEAAGHTVTLRDATDSELANPGDLIIVADAAGLGTKYQAMATPIINLIPAFWDNQGLTTADPPGTPWASQMVITDPAHPLAAGLTGTISFLQSSKGISYITSNELGTATPALVVETTTAGQYTLIGYTSGQTYADNTAAPEARVGLSGLHNQNANPTPDGWAILDAAINWTTNPGGGSGGNSTNGGGGTTIVETITVAHAFAGQSIGVSIDGQYQATVADHLGSASVTRQTNGATVTQRYTPYGAIRGGGINQMAADYTFTGQTDDPGTGLIDYNARAYDPMLGRFIMADPVLDGLNRYTYVGNNPINAIDPTGNSDCPPADVGCNSRSKADEFEGKQDLAVFNSCFQEGSRASCEKLKEDLRDRTSVDFDKLYVKYSYCALVCFSILVTGAGVGQYSVGEFALATDLIVGYANVDPCSAEATHKRVGASGGFGGVVAEYSVAIDSSHGQLDYTAGVGVGFGTIAVGPSTTGILWGC